jgi:tellurite resistance protein
LTFFSVYFPKIQNKIKFQLENSVSKLAKRRFAKATVSVCGLITRFLPKIAIDDKKNDIRPQKQKF